MAFTITDDSASIGATEYFLLSDSTTKTDQTTNGLVSLYLDFVNLAAGDSYRIRFYEAISSGGTARVVEEWTVLGPVGTVNWASPTFVVCHGWEWSVTKIAGTDRTILWSHRFIPE